MKITTNKIPAAGLAALLLLMAAMQAFAQDTRTQDTRPRPQVRSNNPSSYRNAYEYGYRAGYEDGYDFGKRDFDNNQPRDFARNEDYQRADRSYETRMGELREYQDSYQVGFEMAYHDGYYGRPYSVTIPTNLSRIISNASPVANRPRPNDNRRPDDTRTDGRNNDPRRDDRGRDDRANDQGRNQSRDDLFIANGTQLKLRLTTPISTKTNREGDQFTATVMDPSDLAEGSIVGHIAKISRSGRATGKTEVALAFDSLTMRDGRSTRLDAQVDRVYESETVKTVDEEGNVQTGSRTKDTATRGVGGAAVGAIIGAIAGGGKGAAIGAIVGGAAGAGSVYVQGNKDLILEPGTEILIHVNAPENKRSRN